MNLSTNVHSKVLEMAEMVSNKQTVIVEISSDSDSDSDLGEEVPSQDVTLPLSPPAKRKAESAQDERQDQASVPSPKRQKLPVRFREVNESTGDGTHRHVTLEIPVPAKPGPASSENQEVSLGPENLSGTAGVEGQSGRKHIVFDEEEEHEEFVTPLEGPPGFRFGAGEAEAHDEDDEDDDDAPPEAVSSHAAQAQSIEATKAAAKAATQYDLFLDF
jgi:U3 small nucleolar RNA-associated protein 16